MPKRTIPAALAAFVLSTNAAPQTAHRLYSDHGTNYSAWFTYDDSQFWTPLLNGVSNQPHYDAKFSLGRQVEGYDLYLQIAEDVPGVYTTNGCWEDALGNLFEDIVRQQGNQAANSPATLGKAMHFLSIAQGSVTNSVLTNLLICTAAVQVPGPTTNFSTVEVDYTLDWLLSQEYQPDTSTNFDTILHYDTNHWSSNLVAGFAYQGARQLQTLYSVTMTNVLIPWHWQPPIKVYEK